MTSDSGPAAAHEALGEFVIIFQWVENLYRQLGWFILDPARQNWPPMEFRRESNAELINAVTDLFADLVNTHAFPNGAEKLADMLELREHFHNLRKYRNRLLHSTFLEIKGGGEVHGYVRSNPVVGVDAETGELIFDQEEFSASTIHAKVAEFSDYILRLNFIHVQLVHWTPFEKHAKDA